MSRLRLSRFYLQVLRARVNVNKTSVRLAFMRFRIATKSLTNNKHTHRVICCFSLAKTSQAIAHHLSVSFQRWLVLSISSDACVSSVYVHISALVYVCVCILFESGLATMTRCINVCLQTTLTHSLALYRVYGFQLRPSVKRSRCLSIQSSCVFRIALTSSRRSS